MHCNALVSRERGECVAQKAEHRDAFQVRHSHRNLLFLQTFFTPPGIPRRRWKSTTRLSIANDSLIVSLERQLDVAFLLHYDAVLLLQTKQDTAYYSLYRGRRCKRSLWTVAEATGLGSRQLLLKGRPMYRGVVNSGWKQVVVWRPGGNRSSLLWQQQNTKMALSTKHKYNNPRIASYTSAISVLLANRHGYILLFAVALLKRYIT